MGFAICMRGLEGLLQCGEGALTPNPPALTCIPTPDHPQQYFRVVRQPAHPYPGGLATVTALCRRPPSLLQNLTRKPLNMSQICDPQGWSTRGWTSAEGGPARSLSPEAFHQGPFARNLKGVFCSSPRRLQKMIFFDPSVIRKRNEIEAKKIRF